MFIIDVISLFVRITFTLAAQFILAIFRTSPKVEVSSTNDAIITSKDINEIVANYGYIIREHVVTTRDNYVLILHKLERPSSKYLENGKIAYFHHGLCTNSELFVLGSEYRKNLPYLLVELGWEVWLGNNRGNKYSRKHMKMPVSDARFWDFLLDEFAYYDIPDSLNYIHLLYRPSDKITFVGFLQGCAQLFASLSLHPQLHDHLNLFVGLSPPIIPSKYTLQDGASTILKKIVEFSARDNLFLYSLFGRRAILPSVTFWINVLPYWFFERVVDYSLVGLFNWDTANISPEQKRVGYRHMFLCTSVKTVMHWFQIIYHNRFQMFDETCKVGLSSLSTWFAAGSNFPSHKPPPFPIAHHLDLKMLLVYGGRDNLIDIEQTQDLILSQNERMKNKLSVIECPTYEHMDTLWADTVYDDLFVRIVDTMENNLVVKGGSLNGTVRNLSKNLDTQKMRRYT